MLQELLNQKVTEIKVLLSDQASVDGFLMVFACFCTTVEQTGSTIFIDS